MIIDCISDLHGYYPKLEGGDLLIVAGDLTASDKREEYNTFSHWIIDQQYTDKVVIGGNHDNFLEGFDEQISHHFIYLCDTGIEINHEEPDRDEGSFGVCLDVLVSTRRKFKIWGSPWTLKFPGMNPKCMAFTVDSEEELQEKWKLIPDDVDILITHMPGWGIHDQIEDPPIGNQIPSFGKSVGSMSLCRWRANHANSLKLHVYGHIHEGYGVYDIRDIQKKLGDPLTVVMVNASHVNEKYEPVNKPVRIIL